jgi:tetratricopeptide (TPR) repeat protein
LFRINLADNTVSIHRLLLRILDDLWENTATREAHLKQVAEILTKRLQYNIRIKSEVSLAKSITSHSLHLIEMLPSSLLLEQANLLRQLGYHYQYTGEYRAFQQCSERALLLHENHYGQDHPEVAITLYSLSNAYEALGNIEGNQQRLERALMINERYYGKDHITAASIIGSLGNVYGALGDNVKKKVLLERALLILEHQYSNEPEQVSTILTNLGTACDALGNALEAKRYLERALAMQVNVYDKNDQRIAVTLGNLAAAYGNLGDVLKQKALLKKALLIKEHHFGKEHPALAAALDGLGSVYIRLSDHKQSKILLERGLLIKEKAYGKDDPMVAQTLNLLGIVYYNGGEIMRSKELLERALLIQETHYGKNHLEVATVLLNLGNTYGALKNPAMEKDVLERVLSIRESYYGKGHPQVAATLANLGCAHGALGNVLRKKELLEQALAIEEGFYGRDHYEVAMTLCNLGAAYHGLGEGIKSKPLLERALNTQERHYGQKHPLVAQTLFHLGHAELLLNQPSIALQHAQRSLAISQNSGDSQLTFSTKNLIMQCNLVMQYGPELLKIKSNFMGFANNNNGLNQKRTTLQARYAIPSENPSMQDYEKLFRCAAVEGEMEILIDCYQTHGVNINSQDANPRNQRTALHWACVKQHESVIAYLLKQGACFNLVDGHNKMAWEYLVNTPLLVLFKSSADVLLKKYAIKTSVFSTDWGKLLRMAVVNRCLADVRYCIEVLGIDVNSADSNPTSHRTPLHWAVLKNDSVIANYLCSQGAQIGLLDAHAKTALNYAIEIGQEELITVLGGISFIAEPLSAKKSFK